MKQYIVDAFTGKTFSGNPAAVCVMDRWPSEEAMMKLAMENNLSGTAGIGVGIALGVSFACCIGIYHNQRRKSICGVAA